ncbi:cytosolic sulfotransferase 3-like [Amphiprion ocellaris]|uniref:Sulfotransferase n=1 Tax=Amphiprion ocellaris TaxID=80972 RepID=A0A3Q1CLF5_AMPOC|nr:cytosolic sulfotransferase 3-like [Amphiprion ocellaris]XP_035805375.1 cytosolic sulfotransferase 3-like [Amphiprion ocellaris]XP_035805376.1 cytosolic sulfotransferase 3-like [Amphiprion ocellaris]XP_054869194.1 cytosolic sulfotransferase 3-like [Amphiprion ocellaris]XP_054869195.1 cytosolic sulfotransferase 3-like [Amphiprion ocellaris]
MDSSLRPELFNFLGVPMIHYYTNNWDGVQNFQARQDDILLATYPRSGTTWTSYALDLLYFGQKSQERQETIPIYARVPHLEATLPVKQPGSTQALIKETETADKLLTSPRIMKTHLPVQFVPKSFWEQNCRIIYVGRNAKDTVVSYFHLDRMTKMHPEPGDWNTFLQRFMEGKMVFGSWYDHVNGWWKKMQTYSKLHYMFYEDLIEDTGQEIDKLCSFLGLSASTEEKESIRSKVQFSDMKNNSMVNHTTFKGLDFNKSSFIRKGKVGDWKNHFTVAQSEAFDEDYKQKMKDPTLQFRTKI